MILKTMIKLRENFQRICLLQLLSICWNYFTAILLTLLYPPILVAQRIEDILRNLLAQFHRFLKVYLDLLIAAVVNFQCLSAFFWDLLLAGP